MHVLQRNIFGHEFADELDRKLQLLVKGSMFCKYKKTMLFFFVVKLQFVLLWFWVH